MQRTFHDFCLGLIDLPEWMAVTSVIVERTGVEPISISPGERFPDFEGPFTIRIEVRPEAGAPSL